MRRMMSSMLRHYHIPFKLQREVISLFPSVLAATSEHHFKDMIRQLPPFMERQIEDYLRAKLLRQVPFFADLPQDDAPESTADGSHSDDPDAANSDEVPDIVLQISRRLKVRYAAPWDYVIHAGDVGEEMFILVHGAVDVLIPTGEKELVEVMYDDGTTGEEEEIVEKTVATLRSGSFFGEIALLEKTQRTASIQAIQGCELLCLMKADLDELVARSPALQKVLGDAVKRRREETAAQQKKVVDRMQENARMNHKAAANKGAAMSPPALTIVDVEGGDAGNPLRSAAARVMRDTHDHDHSDNSASRKPAKPDGGSGGGTDTSTPEAASSAKSIDSLMVEDS